MKKILLIAVYLLIGLMLSFVGSIEAPTLKEEILTYLYIILLWPFIIIRKIFFG
ncbi:MAG: hypothetical protein HYZ08_01375 [Candidatus Kerfeldbacteria bacterium]|nr:hypothetical protein [Candidatus Kerfeldbacteria bacterium]